MIISEIPWSSQIGFPILGVMQFLPVLGAILLVVTRRSQLAVFMALVLGLVELGLALTLRHTFVPNQPGLQLVERLPIIGLLNYHSGVDGIGVLFMLLTAFLSFMVVVYGIFIRRFEFLPRYLAVVLAMEALIMGQFATVDLLWFTLLTLTQTVFSGQLLRVWATSSEEGPAVARFYQFMGVSLLLLITATLLLGWQHAMASGGFWCSDLPSLSAIELPPALQSVIFYLLLYGLAIRIPMFPLHAWLPLVAEHGTVASAMVLLLGLKTGVYGLIRFVFPLLPYAVEQWHGYVIAIAATGIFYTALLALMQQNLRRLVAYAVVSHTSILVIGLFSLQAPAFQGSIILAANFGLAISTLLFTLGMVYMRTNTMQLSKLGGIFDFLPGIAIAFLVASLAIAGMPGTPGFDAAHLILDAAIHTFGALVTITAALGNVAAVSCLLWAFQHTFLAHPSPKEVITLARASAVETAFVVVMIVVQLVAGFHSEPWLGLVDRASRELATPYQSERKPE
ncbi:NADH dehydrogenase I subunit M [Gammaproteobacteria bacterium]